MDQGGRIGKRRAAPILTRENWRIWFSLQENNLEGKDVYWVISDLWTPQASEDNTPTLQGLRHSRHSPEWRKANATARYELFICLSEDVQDKILEDKKASNVWSKMRAKYSKVYTAHTMAVVREYITFRMSDEWTIRKAWVHLGNLGRRIAMEKNGRGNNRKDTTREASRNLREKEEMTIKRKDHIE